jgi:hypothetical protein
MGSCPDTDAIVTIAEALSWDVADGLQHVQECADCRARLEALQLTRAAFTALEAVDDATIASISAALGVEATRERTRARHAELWAGVFEAVLAGVAGPLVLVSSGIELGSITAGALTFALGAAFFVYGRRLRLYDA